jgi:hypothetical protein
VKAILDVPACATEFNRAETAGDAVCDWGAIRNLTGESRKVLGDSNMSVCAGRSSVPPTSAAVPAAQTSARGSASLPGRGRAFRYGPAGLLASLVRA